MAHIKAEAEEKRKAAEAERIYNEKVEKLKHTAARAALYRKDTGL
jgi:hypothetical protein